MKALNDCSFIGRLGRDPETKYLPNGTCVTEITIACDYTYKDSNGDEVVETNWIPVTSFGKAAELLGEYARKGNRVYINGRFKTDRWEDGYGETKYFTKIYMKDFIVLETKAQNEAQQSTAKKKTKKKAKKKAAKRRVTHAPINNDFDDDIPF